jgi:hypothetical protein
MPCGSGLSIIVKLMADVRQDHLRAANRLV